MADDRDASQTPTAATAPAPTSQPVALVEAPPIRHPRRTPDAGRRRRGDGSSRDRGRRPGRPRRQGMRLEGRTTTSYTLRDDERRTIRYLRLVVGQAHIPDEATVAVDVDRITIEWDD